MLQNDSVAGGCRHFVRHSSQKAATASRVPVNKAATGGRVPAEFLRIQLRGRPVGRAPSLGIAFGGRLFLDQLLSEKREVSVVDFEG